MKTRLRFLLLASLLLGVFATPQFASSDDPNDGTTTTIHPQVIDPGMAGPGTVPPGEPVLGPEEEPVEENVVDESYYMDGVWIATTMIMW